MTTATSWARAPMTSLVEGLERAALQFPNKTAVHYRIWYPQGKKKPVKVGEWLSCTYKQFWARVVALSDNVFKYGARPGDRALVFWIPPSQMDVLALMYGFMKAGVVIVWLDPRTMTFSELLKNIELIAPRVLLADKLVRRVFKTIQKATGRLKSIKVVIGSKEMDGTAPAPPKDIQEEIGSTREQDNEGGVIMFTTGSTGPPKAVRLTENCLAGQVDAYETIARESGLGGPGELTAVHTGMNFNALDLALGNTTITLPDPANPGKILGKWIEEVDERFQPTVITASRILYENLVIASEARKDQSTPYLPHLRLAFSGGAPVTPTLGERVCRAIPNLTDFFSAYGCTEGLPLMVSGWHSTYKGSLESSTSLRSLEQGFGVCLGDLCSHVEVYILRLDVAKEMDGDAGKSKEVKVWQSGWSCVDGETGELVIRSPSVSPRYVNNETANAVTKFHHPEGYPPMHRTGDLVVRDENGLIWMRGRVAQAVDLGGGKLIPPVCIESLFDGKDGVKRSAFVGVFNKSTNKVTPTLIILRDRTHRSRNHKFAGKTFLDKITATKWSFLVENAGLKVLEYTASSEFPMDKRHNSKIRREILSKWAESRI